MNHSSSVERNRLEHVHRADGSEAVKEDALARLGFESRQIRQLANGSVDRNRIGLDETKRAGAVRVFVVGRGDSSIAFIAG